MNRSHPIWLVLVLSVNGLIAFLWLFVYGQFLSFRWAQFAGVRVSSGIFAVAGMLLADVLVLFLFSRKSK
jgi:hypothetical protein